MKKIIAFIMVVLMFGTFYGCTARQTSSNELWIVTEATTWDHMNGQIAVVAEQFEKDHQGITVRIDILPTDTQERSVYIQQLRTQILRGAGPDAYMLPTSNELMVDAARGYEWFSVAPLFPDVVQAMDNGMFRDIGRLYDEDTELDTQSLKTAVMEAGVRDGKRFVLPLRYDIPVIYADVESLAALGMQQSDLEQDADKLMAQVMELGNPEISGAFALLSTGAFSQWMDYEQQQVRLDAATVSAVLRNYQTLESQRAQFGAKMNVRNYCNMAYEIENGLVRYRLYVGSLTDMVEYAPVYQYEQRELAVLPMRSIGGDVVAQVTYYGAVGSGCKDPELAYSFLRMFLLEESQWEQNRPKSPYAVGEKGRKISTTNGTQATGLIEKGWPVRTQGSLQPLWMVRKKQFYDYKTYYADGVVRDRMKRIGKSQMDTAWEQIFAAEPDQVRFGNSMDEKFSDILTLLNDPETRAPTDVDINALAENYWWQLRWHVAEG